MLPLDPIMSYVLRSVPDDRSWTGAEEEEEEEEAEAEAEGLLHVLGWACSLHFTLTYEADIDTNTHTERKKGRKEEVIHRYEAEGKISSKKQTGSVFPFPHSFSLADGARRDDKMMR